MQKDESQFQVILAAIPDMVFRVGRDGKCLDCQGEVGNLRIAREEVIGKYLQDLLPEVVVMSLEAIATTLATENLQTYEYQLTTPSGIKDYEARLVVSGEDEVLMIVRDITERKQVDLQLRNMAQKFSKAFSCSPDPITISTLKEGRYIEVNDSFVRLSGYQRSEVIGRTAFELNMWVNQSDRTQFLHQLEKQGVVRNMTFEFRQKSGEVSIGMISAEIFDIDDTPCLLAVNRDITHRIQVERQLYLSAERDRLLAKTLGAIRQSLKLDQILQTTVNEVRKFLQTDRVFIGLIDPQQGAKIFAESVAPKYPSFMGEPIKDPAVLEEMKKLLTSARVSVIDDLTKSAISAKLKAHYEEFEIKATLAVPIMLKGELFGALIAHQCSSPRNWQSIEIDLLQQMSEQLALAIQQAQLYQELAQLNTNLERQVQERTAELRQKMRELQEINTMKDVVLHTVSHDLRTSVMGNLMVLNHLRNRGTKIRNTNTESEIETVPISFSVIERMIQGNERQLGMINSLLEIHSTEEQGVSLHPELVQLDTLVSTIIKDLQPMLTEHQATVKNLIADELPLVMVDEAQLSRVFINLFTYTCQRNPPGLDFIVKASVDQGMIHCLIQDNGVGMSKTECTKLFNLCVRSPQAGSLTSAGLKLYLCRQIIKAHAGEIRATPNRKHGLTFTFTLPLSS